MSIKIKCAYCGEEKEVGSAKAKYCSSECRNKAFRKLGEETTLTPDPVLAEMDAITQEGNDEFFTALENIDASKGRPLPKENKPLLTGRATPGLFYEGWTRPKYWMRLRDLPETERAEFHAFLKGRNCPVDPTLPTEEQDFYHPWAYSEWKNPEEKVATEPYPTGPLVPMTIPKGESPDQIKERLKRIREYNSIMEPRHHLSEPKLKAMLSKGGYDPNLVRHVWPTAPKPSTELPE